MRRQMQILTALLATTATATGADRDINPVVFLLDEVSGVERRSFDQKLWRDAAGQAGEEVLATFLYADPEGLAKAQAAAGEDAPNVVLLSTVNTPDKDSRAFRGSVEKMEAILAQSSGPDGWPLKIDLPMCKLYEKVPPEGDTVPVSILLLLDDSAARLTCYRLVMSYYSGIPDDTGALVEPLYIDSHAMVRQELMPGPSVHSAYLALKDQRDDKGRYAERPNAIYAPNEEIFLRAYLDHIGRDQGGTVHGTFQIDLTLEVRTTAGEVLGRVDLHSYTGKSTLIYPIDKTYFWNNITAGVSLPDPGDYVLAFQFKDMSRPNLPPAEAVFEVTVK